MNSFDSVNLSNSIPIINRHNPNTPRTSMNFIIDGGNRTELIPGVSDLVGRLLLKGTKKYSAEDIANEIDNNALEINVEVKQDYSRIRATFLNEDIDKALETISDISQNPTFELFEKEIKLYMGELQVDLDSPKAKATDNLIKEMYPNHPYGVVSSVILANIPKMTLDEVLSNFRNNFNAGNTSIVSVGNFESGVLQKKLEEKFGHFKAESKHNNSFNLPVLNENKIITASREDASQAQVLLGWYGPPISSEDFAPLTVLNNLLGASGLSSRLFVELRDKKGLAYAVRSTYEVFRYASNFTVYIGTEPKNIKIAIDGIYEEIGKLISTPVTEAELDAAKKNILGKRAIFHETNSQQCNYMGLYCALGIGAAFDTKVPELIKQVTKADIQKVAQKYLSKHNVTSVLAPSEFLKLVTKG